MQANQNCLKYHIIMDIISNNNNKYDRVAECLHVKQKINIALYLLYNFS